MHLSRRSSVSEVRLRDRNEVIALVVVNCYNSSLCVFDVLIRYLRSILPEQDRYLLFLCVCYRLPVYSLSSLGCMLGSARQSIPDGSTKYPVALLCSSFGVFLSLPPQSTSRLNFNLSLHTISGVSFPIFRAF